MAAKDNSTTEIPLRAAKGVSRFFLFDALRTGCEEIDTTSSHLGSARDKAEKILAKESAIEFESLIRDVLQSCAKSLQAHVAIVEAVAETMRGDVDELDKKAMDKLEDLLFLATEVRNAATGIEVVSNDNVKKEESPPLPTESDFDSEPEVQSSKKPKTEEPKETTLPKKKKTKSKHASNSSAPVTENPLPDIADEKPMKGKGKKLSKPSEPSNSSKTSPQDLPPATPESAPKQQSFVDEDDINAEVDARLAAKEAKRAKKKESKKRKRDSVASDIFSPEPKTEPANAIPPPAKKKARVDKVDADVKGKRQNVDDAPGVKSKGKKQMTSDAAEKEEKSVEANKAKRRRSSNTGVTDAPAATPQTNNRNKKRKVGF